MYIIYESFSAKSLPLWQGVQNLICYDFYPIWDKTLHWLWFIIALARCWIPYCIRIHIDRCASWRVPQTFAVFIVTNRITWTWIYVRWHASQIFITKALPIAKISILTRISNPEIVTAHRSLCGICFVRFSIFGRVNQRPVIVHITFNAILRVQSRFSYTKCIIDMKGKVKQAETPNV